MPPSRGISTTLYTLKFTWDPPINRSLLCKNPMILQGDFQLYKYNLDVMEKNSAFSKVFISFHYSDYTIPGYPLRRASQSVQKLFEVTLLYFYCRREKTIKGGNFLWRMKLKKLFSGFAISHALWTIFLLFKSRTSSALQFYSESQGRANGRNCNWRLQFGIRDLPFNL